MNREKEITIYDLANQLGVSPATVSRALKNNPSISNATRKKVNALAEKLGYRHNTFASNLRLQRTNTIGVILHELNSHFIISVLAGIEKVATASKYNLIIGHSSETTSLEIANVNNFFHKRVDGVLASLAYDTNDLSHFAIFKEKQVPVVFFDRVYESEEGTKVIIDNAKAAYQATMHLVEQGCKRIVHITGNLNRNVYARRLEGYKQALADAKLSSKKDYIIINNLEENDGVEAARLILKMKPLPDGIFVTRDLCAAVCMQTLKDTGIRIPEDIAVIGFNNDVISRITQPKLSTIDYPGFQMGEIACRQLINHLKGVDDTTVTKNIYIRSSLIVRESSLRTGKLKEQE